MDGIAHLATTVMFYCQRRLMKEGRILRVSINPLPANFQRQIYIDMTHVLEILPHERHEFI